jgi:hypothetical protein
MVDRSAHGLDALARDENLAGLKEIAGIDLEQPRGVKDDGRLLRGGEERQRKEQDGAA